MNDISTIVFLSPEESIEAVAVIWRTSRLTLWNLESFALFRLTLGNTSTPMDDSGRPLEASCSNNRPSNNAGYQVALLVVARYGGGKFRILSLRYFQADCDGSLEDSIGPDMDGRERIK